MCSIEPFLGMMNEQCQNRGPFPHDESVMKLLYLALRNISKKWSMPVHNWKGALNRFAIMYEDRMPQF